MKLSNAVHHMATFGISAIGILTVAAILGLAERNLHTTETYATEEPVHEDVVETVYYDIDHLRAGYIGEFGYTAIPPHTAEPVERLPEVVHVERESLSLVTPSASSRAPMVKKKIKRPFIRVGLFSVEDAEQVKVAVNNRSQIVLGDGTVAKANVKKNRTITIFYNKTTAEYTVQRGSWELTTSEFVRVVPKKPHSVVTVKSYENRPSWDTSLNDNEFLGKFEVQYAPATDTIWAVNELGIENYVKGLAEASNDNDPAYLKALVTAARTYVYTIGDKHSDEPYDVDTSPNDQVYRGYGFTQRGPNIEAAVDATRGRIVHYEGEAVITPYFSITDGRTRSWEEVWNGSREYLVSKDDPCCDEETLLGHGVGMSATGARFFAEEEDWGWKTILKYYYTGVSVPKVW